MSDLFTLEEAQRVSRFVWNHPKIKKTPLFQGVEEVLPPEFRGIRVSLKLDNLQESGCFKYRGVCYQAYLLKNNPDFDPEKPLVTYSGGNYGKAFSMMCKEEKMKGKVLMPNTVPSDRIDLIQGNGCEVELYPSAQLPGKVQEYADSGLTYLHSFDDLNLIKAYTSVAFEILEKEAAPDVVLVCCGGGGILSGVAAGLRLSGLKNTKVFGVEPENACTMKRSFEEGKPVSMAVKSVATGLSPPLAGQVTYKVCSEFVDDIILVSDSEIVSATQFLAEKLKMIVEPSGAAAFAALFHHKIPLDLAGKNVVAVITGGNISLQSLAQLFETKL